jgi:hypothetical protein
MGARVTIEQVHLNPATMQVATAVRYHRTHQSAAAISGY